MTNLSKTTATCVSRELHVRKIIESILAKNGHTANIVNSRAETMKCTEGAFYNSEWSSVQFPEIELITNALRKIEFILLKAHVLWPEKSIAEKIVADVVKIISQTCQRNFSFYNGKALKCILAGLFYILGFRYGDPKKQREICVVFQITDVTVRAFYKQWLKEFPDMFQDVIKILDQKPCHCMIGSDYNKRRRSQY
jgi:hypothetical protein